MSQEQHVRALMDSAIRMAGSQEKLGKAIGMSQHAIWMAKRLGKVSAEMAAGIDKATDGQISKSDLRPDLWPPIDPMLLQSPAEQARS